MSSVSHFSSKTLSLNWITRPDTEGDDHNKSPACSWTVSLSILVHQHYRHYTFPMTKMNRAWSTFLVLMVILQSTSCSPLPQACSQQSQGPTLQDCAYDTTKDQCGNEVCLRGPGEMCGGKYGRWKLSRIEKLIINNWNSRYGTCADGLMCSNCNRCQGCSFRTFICWEDKNCIYWPDQLKFW